MRRYRGSAGAVITLSVFFCAWATGAGGSSGSVRLDVVNSEKCPIQILERKSRVGQSPVRDPWRMMRGEGFRAPTERKYGPGESQVVFHVGFKNSSRQDIEAVAFLWQAFNANDELVYQRFSVDGRRTLRSGEARTLYESDVDPNAQVAWYRVSVLQANFSDGSKWISAPPEDDPETP